MHHLIKNAFERKAIRITLFSIIIFILLSMIVTFYGIYRNMRLIAAFQGEANKIVFANYPSVDLAGKTPAEIQQIKAGEYWTKAGDCISCHTNTTPDAKPFTGGRPIHVPFGTIYSPNITPDVKTGIGSWTLAQFDTAMRKGISPLGHYYYPAFPYPYFAKFNSVQMAAIKAYLDSIPPVEAQNIPDNMVWPFNIRELQFFWRYLFFKKPQEHAYIFKTTHTAFWNRGAFLVEGPGHCAMCHTPSYHLISPKLSLGAPMTKYNLTGARIENYIAPNITQSMLGDLNPQKIVNVFLQDKMIDDGPVQGPMLEVNHNSLRYLTNQDLTAIAVYLQSVDNKAPVNGGSNSTIKETSQNEIGKTIYNAHCFVCHATGVNKAPKFGDKQAWNALIQKDGSMTVLYDNAVKGINKMPPKGACANCTPEQIQAATDYMISDKKP